jgi:hypothetical protein
LAGDTAYLPAVYAPFKLASHSTIHTSIYGAINDPFKSAFNTTGDASIESTNSATVCTTTWAAFDASFKSAVLVAVDVSIESTKHATITESYYRRARQMTKYAASDAVSMHPSTQPSTEQSSQTTIQSPIRSNQPNMRPATQCTQ